ncbi:hypothetical protein ACJX0J_029147 [Zea mays]
MRDIYRCCIAGQFLADVWHLVTISKCHIWSLEATLEDGDPDLASTSREEMKNIHKRALAVLRLALADNVSLEEIGNSLFGQFNKAVLDYQNVGNSMDNDHLAILFLSDPLLYKFYLHG